MCKWNRIFVAGVNLNFYSNFSASLTWQSRKEINAFLVKNPIGNSLKPKTQAESLKPITKVMTRMCIILRIYFVKQKLLYLDRGQWLFFCVARHLRYQNGKWKLRISPTLINLSKYKEEVARGSSRRIAHNYKVFKTLYIYIYLLRTFPSLKKNVKLYFSIFYSRPRHKVDTSFKS